MINNNVYTFVFIIHTFFKNNYKINKNIELVIFKNIFDEN